MIAEVSYSPDRLTSKNYQKTETKLDKNPDPSLTIEQVDIYVPIVLNVDGNNKTEYLKALESGVAHMKDTALPGQFGNMVIFGHSSFFSDQPGEYKTIFKPINKIEIGDLILIQYNKKDYRYKVIKKKIVKPDDVSVVQQDLNKKLLTIITCWPPQTTTKRYVIVSELE